jgi:hypothetical protein
MTLQLPPDTQKRIDRLDFQASRLDLEHTARKDIDPSTPTARAAWLKGHQAEKESRKLRRHIQQLIIQHHENHH